LRRSLSSERRGGRVSWGGSLVRAKLAVVDRVGAATPLGYIWPCNPCVRVESIRAIECQHTGRSSGRGVRRQFSVCTVHLSLYCSSSSFSVRERESEQRAQLQRPAHQRPADHAPPAPRRRAPLEQRRHWPIAIAAVPHLHPPRYLAWICVRNNRWGAENHLICLCYKWTRHCTRRMFCLRLTHTRGVLH